MTANPAGAGAAPGSGAADAAKASEPLERRLVQLGGLFAGFAHEIKNPLSTIGLQLQLLREDLEKACAVAKDGALVEQRSLKRLTVLQSEVRRLQGILDEFLRYVRVPELELAPVDLNRSVQSVVDFVEPEVTRQGTVLRFSPDPGLGPITVDEKQLRQAFLNFLINAKQALEEQIKTGGQPGEILVECRRQGDGVRIVITDTGPGMSPDVLERCLQPYFSTKKGGSGLGMPTARRIVEDHGGQLTVVSEKGRGTRVQVDLPARPPQRGARGGAHGGAA